jgi:hypothetical protein
MRTNELTRGEDRRLMYVENNDGEIDGAPARIGWVTFSRTGLSVHYRGRTFKRAKGGGVRGNYYDEATRGVLDLGYQAARIQCALGGIRPNRDRR